MALVDPFATQRFQRTFQEGSCHAPSAMSVRGNQVMNEPASAVVPTKDGPNERLSFEGHKAHSWVSRKITFDWLEIIGRAKTNAIGAFPQRPGVCEVRCFEFADLQ